MGLAIIRKIRLAKTPKKFRDLAEHDSAEVRTLTPSEALDNLRLRQNFLHHVAVDISQAEVTPGIAIGQSLVIESQQVKQGGVEIVHVNLVLDCLVAELVGCAIGEAGLDATASQPGREPLGIVIATKIASGSFLFSGILNVGRAAEFTAAPDDSVF